MSHPYTDRYGHPLKATEVLRRLQKGGGQYDETGRWHKRRSRKKPTTPTTTESNPPCSASSISTERSPT